MSHFFCKKLPRGDTEAGDPAATAVGGPQSSDPEETFYRKNGARSGQQGYKIMNSTDNDNDRTLTMSEIMTPEKVNFAGNIHGGHLLKLIDETAYACAARYCGGYVVTLSVDQVLFKQPIRVGELVTCLANINYVGKTSLEVGIKVVAENLATKERRHTNSCYLTMVAVDTHLKPVNVKPLRLHNETQRRRFEEAQARKAARLESNKKHSGK